ncbi:DUF1818 family protein [Cyanobacterium stanieri]|uniref:DUF1818 family protein n=1 Tax=Cyanobacterium stanieri TaxID=102235 RepID=UPI00321FA70E
MLKKGKGWRIGWQEKPEIYKGLIGADNWAFELSGPEMEDFCRLLIQINDTMETMAEHLMEEETISCEVESPLLWLGADGYINDYSLRIIIYEHRGAEGSWQSDVIPDLIKAIQSLKSF